MSIHEQVEKVLKDNGIKFLKGNGETENIFNVPYRGIENQNNHINIYMEIVDELNLIQFLLVEKANDKIDINELKSSLLNINSQLNFGTLSMRNESDTIEYKVDCQIGTEEFSFEQYERFIISCIRIYETLKKEDLIL